MSTPARNGSEPFVTKSEYVARRLREMVISGEMPPGTKVRQQQVAEQFNVSPTPVREAIRQLEAEGYFESAPHVSARVAYFDHDALDEVYQVRALLEGRLAREAVRHMTPEVLERLRTLSAEFEDAVTRGDTVAERRTNYRFHSLVWQTAGQPVTLSLVESLWAKFPQVLSRVPDRGARSTHEHARLLEALEAGDGAAAEAAVHAHVASGRAEMMQAGGGAGPVPKPPSIQTRGTA